MKQNYAECAYSVSKSCVHCLLTCLQNSFETSFKHIKEKIAFKSYSNYKIGKVASFYCCNDNSNAYQNKLRLEGRISRRKISFVNPIV